MRFKRQLQSQGISSKGETEISTASLPDIIFMLLFFFMVVTVLKTESPLFKFELPKAKEINKIQHKSYQSYIYIGDMPFIENNKVRIQFNDKFIGIKDIQTGIINVTSKYDYADPNKISFSLKIDRNAKMRIIDMVKDEIKKSEFRKINYVALSK
jgi:biopolymer transport protein ExbD